MIDNKPFFMNIRILITLFIFFIVNSYSWAQAPKYSNEFLSIGVGARGLSMGNSITVTSSGAEALYWNPANLVLMESDMEIAAMHAEYFAGIGKYDFIGISKKLENNQAVGVSMLRFGVDDIPNTLELIDSEGNVRYDRIKSFSAADYAFLFTYAKKSDIEGLNYGGSVKIIRRVTGDFASAWGFGFDIAARYNYKNTLFALMIKDPTSTFNAWSFNTTDLTEVFELTGNEIPVNSIEVTMPKLIPGVARKFNLTEKLTLLSELNLIVTTDGKRNVLLKGDPFSIDPAGGIELAFNELLFFRAGVSGFQQIPGFDGQNEFNMQPGLGLGLKLKGLKIDYALSNIGNAALPMYTHVFSLSYGINKKMN